MPIQRTDDGFYHPANLDELQALVRHAHDTATRVRVSGAQMSSVAAAVRGDPGSIEILLDRMRGIEWVQKANDHAVVAVEAGCLLGRAYDDRGGQSWKGSLSYELQVAGYALDQLAGVSHQTLGGFLMTGSAGGSVRHALFDDVQRILLVDGTGALHDLERGHPDSGERFLAAGVSMGLLGVIAKVWLRAAKTYNVVGGERTSTMREAPIDFVGPGDDERPSFEAFLRRTDYARVLWWPQNDFDRVQIWTAERAEPDADFEPLPFELLSKRDSLLGSLFTTIMGNLDDLSVVPEKLESWHEELERYLDGEVDRIGCPRPRDEVAVSREEVFDALRQRLKRAVTKHPTFNEGDDQDDDFALLRGDREGDDEGIDWSDKVADLLLWAIDEVLDGYSGKALGRILKRLLPGFIDELLGIFVADGEHPFRDTWMCGLPIDNQMEEALWRTDFTELWFPIEHSAEVVRRLRRYFAAGGDVDEAYRRTGPFTVELYAGPKSDFWLNPGYGTPCLRLNVFWFRKWAGSPRDSFYPPLWELLADLGFRPHWGKHLPEPSARWLAHYRDALPRFDDFLALRAELDPKQIFVSDYWRANLGIAPA